MYQYISEAKSILSIYIHTVLGTLAILKLCSIKIFLEPFLFKSICTPIIFTSNWARAESTKQMEQTLRAKVKIFFKSENLENAFNKK